jgi:hypothetical protein
MLMPDCRVWVVEALKYDVVVSMKLAEIGHWTPVFQNAVPHTAKDAHCIRSDE